MNIFRIFLITMLIVALSHTCSALTLVSQGQSAATIVTSATALSDVQNVAVELQSYIKQISGAVIPIKRDSEQVYGTLILVGVSTLTNGLGVSVPQTYPDGERFIVKTLGDNLVLLGNDAKSFHGTEFAVYDFLQDQLGVKWYFPDPCDIGTVIPFSSDIVIGTLDVSESPACSVRSMYVPSFLSSNLSRRNAHWKWAMHNKLPGLLIDHSHNFFNMFPPSQYWPTHADYYNLGSGTVPLDGGWNWQLQVQYQPVRDETAIKAKAYFSQSSSSFYNYMAYQWLIPAGTLFNDIGYTAVPTMFSLSPNDGDTAYFCQTSQCNSYGNPAHRMLDYATNVRSQVQSSWPNALYAFYAYYTTFSAPSPVLSPKADSHIMPVLATSDNFCHVHAIDDSMCPRNVIWLANFHAWEQSVQRMFLYDYMWYQEFREMTYIGLNQLKHFLEMMSNSEVVDGLSGEMTSDFGPYGIRNYIMGKYLWDGIVNSDSMFLMQYCQDLYGDAWDPMYQYLLTWDSAVANCGIHANAWGMPDPAEIFTPAIETQLDIYREQAEALYDSQNDIVKRRLDRQFLQWKYDRTTLWMLRALRNYQQNPFKTYKLASLIERWQALQEPADQAWLICKTKLSNFNPLQLPAVQKVCPNARSNPDINCDGIVDLEDIVVFSSQWLQNSQ